MKDHTSPDDDAYECATNKAAALAWYWAEGECRLQQLCGSVLCADATMHVMAAASSLLYVH
jgi:hypothetical protein